MIDQYADGSPTGMAVPGAEDPYALSEAIPGWSGLWCPSCVAEFEAYEAVCPWCRTPAIPSAMAPQAASGQLDLFGGAW